MSKAEALAKALGKAIGGNDEQTSVDMWLDTGFPPLNHAISGRYDGGLPVGRIVEMFGPSSCGKTAIATCAMAAAQRAEGICGFSDHERSFHAGLAGRLGLDTDDPSFVYKSPDTFEQAVTIAIKAAEAVRDGKLIDPKAPVIWVFDSLASMVPMSKWGKGVDEYSMNDTTALARATSAVFPALAKHCEHLNMLCLFLNQMRTKPGVAYGDPTTSPGGEAPKFYSSVRIQLGATRLMDGKGDDRRMLGQEIRARCVKNKVYRPFLTANWRFMFRADGSGFFDVTRSMLDYLIGINVLKSGGSRVEWVDGKSYHVSVLAKKIEDEGLQAELMKLLPESSEAPESVDAEAADETSDDEAA